MTFDDTSFRVRDFWEDFVDLNFVYCWFEFENEIEKLPELGSHKKVDGWWNSFVSGLIW
jgi:hypothetical protein